MDIKKCLESWYWQCCEERFCFDKDIATCRLEDAYSEEWEQTSCYTNRAGSFDSVITHQPPNNNHIPNGVSREVQELPVMASQIYAVFSKSMIFKEENTTKDDFKDVPPPESYHSPVPDMDFRNGKQNRIVSFEDEVIEAQNEMTDFEIMFKDELLSKIEEEDEHSDKIKVHTTPEDIGIIMKPLKSPITKKVSSESLKETTIPKDRLNEIRFGVPLHKTKSDANIKILPRVESVKGILRISSLKSITNANSTGNLTDSTNSLNKQEPEKKKERKISRVQLARVESLKNIDTRNINKILAKLPQRSASFLSIPEHILQADKANRLSREVFAISSSKLTGSSTEFSQLSHMPDTPVIKSSNFPKFFEDTPVIGEYKGDTSLVSLQKPSDVIFTECDYSMPRYYGKGKSTIPDSLPLVHESKSMPDLRNAEGSKKVSKRLVKIRSRLKPLIIKKSEDGAKSQSQK